MNTRTTILFLIVTVTLLFALQGSSQTSTGEIPSSETMVSLAKGLRFDTAPVASGPVLAQHASNFSMEVHFRAKMVDLDPDAGAIAAKITIQGVPPEYNIPDDTYYLWMGRVDARLRAALVKMDGSLQTELCAEALPMSTNIKTNTLASSVGSVPCDMAALAAGSSQRSTPPGTTNPTPPNPPPPKPPESTKPPRTQKRTIQDICYNEDHNKPVTKYRKGVIWVPDS